MLALIVFAIATVLHSVTCPVARRNPYLFYAFAHVQFLLLTLTNGFCGILGFHFCPGGNGAFANACFGLWMILTPIGLNLFVLVLSVAVLGFLTRRWPRPPKLSVPTTIVILFDLALVCCGILAIVAKMELQELRAQKSLGGGSETHAQDGAVCSAREG